MVSFRVLVAPEAMFLRLPASEIQSEGSPTASKKNGAGSGASFVMEITTSVGCPDEAVMIAPGPGFLKSVISSDRTVA
jgi:hypothetical protein